MSFLVLAVNADSPHIDTLQTTEGITVRTPYIEYINQNQDFTLIFNPFNNTNGLRLNNSQATCESHLTSNSGIIIPLNVSYIDNHFQANISKYYTRNLGYLSYSIRCYTTNSGGQFVGTQKIEQHTEIGYTDDASQGLSITLFVILATLIMFALPRMYGTFSDNKIVNLIVIRCCYVIGFYLMVMNAGLLSSIATSAGYATAEIFRYMWLFGIAGYLLMAVTTLKTLFDVVNLYNQLIKERRGLM